jgi:hypothetical protein
VVVVLAVVQDAGRGVSRVDENAAERPPAVACLRKDVAQRVGGAAMRAGAVREQVKVAGQAGELPLASLSMRPQATGLPTEAVPPSRPSARAPEWSPTDREVGGSPAEHRAAQLKLTGAASAAVSDATDMLGRRRVTFGTAIKSDRVIADCTGALSQEVKGAQSTVQPLPLYGVWWDRLHLVTAQIRHIHWSGMASTWRMTSPTIPAGNQPVP